MTLPLAGRTALITGVSRRRGIGFAVATRLAEMGADLVVHQYADHDRRVYGTVDDPREIEQELVAQGVRVLTLTGDLMLPTTPGRLVELAVERAGHLDILVCNHAHGGDQVSLATVSPRALDRHWAVNTRGTILLTQAFAAQHDGRDGGRVIWMTSGQGHGPMSDNLAYAVSKAALAGATASVADELVERGILLNTVNPGPVNTGYLDDAPAELMARFPQGRPGTPEDPARLIGWLVSDEGRWVVGQVLSSEGGFRR